MTTINIIIERARRRLRPSLRRILSEVQKLDLDQDGKSEVRKLLVNHFMNECTEISLEPDSPFHEISDYTQESFMAAMRRMIEQELRGPAR